MPSNGMRTLKVGLAAYEGKPSSVLGGYNLLIETSHPMGNVESKPILRMKCFLLYHVFKSY